MKLILNQIHNEFIETNYIASKKKSWNYNKQTNIINKYSELVKLWLKHKFGSKNATLIWDFAYEEGHSGGLHETIDWVNQISRFVVKLGIYNNKKFMINEYDE